ncbi:MAG: ATP-binding protein [Thermotogales bacterium]|nr:ATP-binding protein [Thermotogales bacterium]
MECNDQLVTLTFCSRASRLKLLRCVVRDAADLIGLDEQATDAVVLAVNEACMNIIQHAYKMEPNGRIDVTLIREQGALVVQLHDYADKVDVEKVCSRDLDDVRPGGLGVHLIDCLMDEHGFKDPPGGVGNLFQMKKYIEA